jgi:glycosyltransferase involved in cell wall biosynthesis
MVGLLPRSISSLIAGDAATTMAKVSMRTTSIIIPTHNRPHLLPQAVTSAQSAGASVEVVVVDDASTDETAAVCEGLTNIKYVRLDRNHGVAGARNAGIMASSGDYISFLDDDDTRLSGSLDLQVQAFEKNPDAALVYGKAIVGNSDGSSSARLYPTTCPRGNIFWDLVKQNFIPCGSAVFLRSSVLNVGFLDQELAGIDDWDLWIRLAEVYPIAAVDQPVMIWRRSSPKSDQGTSDAVRIVALATTQFKKWMMLPAAAQASRKQRRAAWLAFSENLASHLIWEAGRAWALDRRNQALSDVYTAVRLHPRGVMRLTRKFLPSNRVDRSGTTDGSDLINEA